MSSLLNPNAAIFMPMNSQSWQCPDEMKWLNRRHVIILFKMNSGNFAEFLMGKKINLDNFILWLMWWDWILSWELLFFQTCISHVTFQDFSAVGGFLIYILLDIVWFYISNDILQKLLCQKISLMIHQKITNIYSENWFSHIIFTKSHNHKNHICNFMSLQIYDFCDCVIFVKKIIFIANICDFLVFIAVHLLIHYLYKMR